MTLKYALNSSQSRKSEMLCEFHEQNYELYLWFKKKCSLTALCSPRELCLYLDGTMLSGALQETPYTPFTERKGGRCVCAHLCVFVGGCYPFLCASCFANACAQVCAKSLNKLKLCFILTHPEILFTFEVKDPTLHSRCLWKDLFKLQLYPGFPLTLSLTTNAQRL